MMMLVIIKCEIFKKSRKNRIMSVFWNFLASLLILLILNVALMAPITFLITPNVSKKLF